MNHKIAVVFDFEFGEQLCPLAREMHVWIVRSSTNDTAIENYLNNSSVAPNEDPLASGVTQFEETELTSDLLETIWEHHGEFAHDPPLAAMRIIGISRDPRIVDILTEFQCEVSSGGDGDFWVTFD